MKQYTDLLREILTRGRLKQNRTGVDTLSLIDAPQMVFDLDEGFPLVTERPIYFKGVVGENIWFLNGICNNEDLLAQDIKIWDKWALKEEQSVEELRPLPEVVDEYVEIRHRELGRGEDLSPEALGKTFEEIQPELQAADEEDHAKGLPTMMDPKDARGPEDMMGGFRLLRERNIAFRQKVATLPKGYLGPIYGVLWRRWPGLNGQMHDQIQTMLDKLSSDNPKLRYSRANIVTAFHPALLPDETVNAQTNILRGRQALAACHTMFQLFAEPLTLEERTALFNLKHPEGPTEDVNPTGTIEEFYDEHSIPRDRLSLKLYQRSADVPVGIPFNIAGYALLLHMFAAQLKMKPGLFIHTLGDAHIYVDQVEGVKELLARVDNPDIEVPALPQLKINPEVPSLFEYKIEDFTLVDYNPLKPQIKFPVAE